MTMHKILVFKRFERIWHWSQMALIFTLLFSGFAVHGVHSLINFGDAVTVHTWTAIVLLLIWAFAIFWLFTTGAVAPLYPDRGKFHQGCPFLRLRASSKASTIHTGRPTGASTTPCRR